MRPRRSVRKSLLEATVPLISGATSKATNGDNLGNFMVPVRGPPPHRQQPAQFAEGNCFPYADVVPTAHVSVRGASRLLNHNHHHNRHHASVLLLSVCTTIKTGACSQSMRTGAGSQRSEALSPVRYRKRVLTCDEATTCMLRTEASEHYRHTTMLSPHSTTYALHYTTWSVVELCVQSVTSVHSAVRVWYWLVVELCVLYQSLVVVRRVRGWFVRSSKHRTPPHPLARGDADT